MDGGLGRKALGRWYRDVVDTSIALQMGEITREERVVGNYIAPLLLTSFGPEIGLGLFEMVERTDSGYFKDGEFIKEKKTTTVSGKRIKEVYFSNYIDYEAAKKALVE